MGWPMSDETKYVVKFSPKSVRIFEESDGWHYCAAELDYYDARGRGYPSRAAAMRAARESHEMHQRIGGDK